MSVAGKTLSHAGHRFIPSGTGSFSTGGFLRAEFLHSLQHSLNPPLPLLWRGKKTRGGGRKIFHFLKPFFPSWIFSNLPGMRRGFLEGFFPRWESTLLFACVAKKKFGGREKL